jgi:hypothetical protein
MATDMAVEALVRMGCRSGTPDWDFPLLTTPPVSEAICFQLYEAAQIDGENLPNPIRSLISSIDI